MKKFNLKEHIAKNKATFFSSLNEGQFSWMTQDTGQQIGSQEGNTIPVYMFDNTGKYWFEKEYEGYGVFGGKDYYELLDQMNGGTGDRSEGIRKAFDPTAKGKTLFPALVVGASNFNYKTHDFTQEAETDPNQSWLSPEDEGDNMFDDDDNYDYGMGFGDMDTPENYDEDELDEGKAAYEYEKGKKAGEEIEKKKMKKSELKAKIKEMIVAEMNLDVTDETSGYDFLAELEGMLNEEDEDFSIKLLVPTVYYNPETGELAKTPAAFGADSELEDMGITNYSDGDELSEWVFDNDIEKAKYFEKEYPGLFKVEGAMNEAKDEEVEDEVDVDIEGPETMDEPTGGINVTQNADADLTGTEKEVQDNLEAAMEAAKKLGDEKLSSQIGNTLTFFTRQHVVKENLKETLLLQKRAGIITETQYKQKLNEISEDEDEVPLTSKVKSFINKAIADSKKDGEFEELKKADWFENELIDELISLFPNKDYDSASSKVTDYIKDKIK